MSRENVPSPLVGEGQGEGETDKGGCPMDSPPYQFIADVVTVGYCL